MSAGSTYTITITLHNVAQGDVTDLAQTIWDENADDLDARLGDFAMVVSRGGFPIDWDPNDAG
jgi:hypothetical protein